MSRSWKPTLTLQASLALHGIALISILSELESWPLGVSTLAFNHAGLTIAGLLPRTNLLGPNLTRLPVASAARHEIALTLDDGPDPEITPRVLDLLDAANAKATFFCIGHRARRYPEICRQIVARGHRIENHSDTHSWAFSIYGPQRIKNDIWAAQQTLADITGELPRFFRPTAGLRNVFLEPVLCELDMMLATWSRRSYDTQEGRSTVVLERLSKHLEPGEILLMHDGHSARMPDGSPVILDVLPKLLSFLTHQQLKPVTLAHAIYEI